MQRLIILGMLCTNCNIGYSLGPYFVTEIGALAGGDATSIARDVNALGQVVGISTTASGDQAILWQPSVPNGTAGTIIELEDLAIGGNSYAFALNDYGQVVGRSTTQSGERAFLWQPELANGTIGQAYDLGDLPGGGDHSSAAGLNARGQIVGYSQAATGLRSFLWQPTSANGTIGSLIDLGDLPGGEDYSVAHDINDFGQVVGSSWTIDERHPFLWNPESPNDSSGVLYDLGDLPDGRDEGGAISINERGMIVGHSSASTGFRGFVTSINELPPMSSDLIDLGDLPAGSDYSLARDINNHGQIVGVGTTDGQRAVTWSDAGRLFDLNDLLDPTSGKGWTLNYATGINDSGQIVGYGTLEGNIRGFLLTPIVVPTPGTASLLIIELLTLMFGSRFQLRREGQRNR